VHARVLRELHREELERPGRPLPTELLRRAVDVADESLRDVGRDLPRWPLLALVEE
jgi:hypothetical protein